MGVEAYFPCATGSKGQDQWAGIMGRTEALQYHFNISVIFLTKWSSSVLDSLVR